MLQGSLDNFTIPEILGLLASTTKTGRLKISGDRGTGSIWCADGKLEYAEASKLAGPHGIDDVMLELLRYQSGNFSFHADDVLPDGAEATSEDVDTVLAGAATRLEEWYAIEAVVPSLGHSLTPAASLATKDVTLDADEWEFLVAIGDSRSVGDVADRLGLGEIDVSRRAKGLIERELVDIAEHPSRRAADVAPVDDHVVSDGVSVASSEPEAVPETVSEPVPEAGLVADEQAEDVELTGPADLPEISEPIAFDEPVETELPATEPIAFDDPAPAALDSTFAADSGVAPISFSDPAPVDPAPTHSFADALAETVADSNPSKTGDVGLSSSIFEPAPSVGSSNAVPAASDPEPTDLDPTDLASLRESILSEDESGTDTSVLMQFLNNDR